MHELRKDPIIGRWVIMAKGRARRPGNFIISDSSLEGDLSARSCCFCEGHEAETPSEIFAIRKKKSSKNKPGWQVRVVPDKNPFLGTGIDLTPKGHGLYDVLEGRGVHEIIIESPDHVTNLADLPVEQIERVIQTYGQRLKELEKDERLKYILAHKNHKWTRYNQNIAHAYSEIIATPVIPMRVREELTGAKKYFSNHERCIFCDLIKQEIEANQRVVFQTDDFIVLVPFASRFPFELWILPKQHDCRFSRGVVGLEKELAGVMRHALQKIKMGLGDPAYHFVVHSAPYFRPTSVDSQGATIEEDYHWHIELMPRLTHMAGFEKGTGFYICPIPPEEATSFLKDVEVVL